MHVTIRYALSEQGRKASLLAGGNGQAIQEVQVPQDSPLFAAALEQATVAADGRAVLDLTTYRYGDAAVPAFDRLPSVEELLAARPAALAAKAERDRTEATELRQKTEAVLAGREVRTRSIGLSHGESYTELSPDWPYRASREVTESPAAVAWLAELASQNAAAKAAAEGRTAEKAAAEAAQEQAAAIAEQERRAALGLRDGDLDLDVEEGALTEVPPGCWESHSRGKNWLAQISIEPACPGGLDRAFAVKAKGSFFYLVPGDLVPGQAVEFGADYYSGRGRKSPTRWYGYVVRVEAARLVLHQCATAKAAVKAGREFAATLPPVPTIEDEVAAGIRRVNGEGGIEPSAN